MDAWMCQCQSIETGILIEAFSWLPTLNWSRANAALKSNWILWFNICFFSLSIKAKPALQQDSLDKTRKGDVIIFCFHFVQKNKTLQHISLIWNGIFPNCASLLNFLTSLCSSILEATSASGCWVLMGSRVKKHLYSTWYRSVFRRLPPFNVQVM